MHLNPIFTHYLETASTKFRFVSNYAAHHAITMYTLSMIVAMFFLLMIINTINKKNKTEIAKPINKNMITSHDIRAIAGDDVLTTQLDLARAYIEMGKQQFAKKILIHVLDKGSDAQKSEANRLINTL